ncbi:unnamed protein product [Lathyrus sativus]|nr:unnamed protein product [Lathyrus sativus]
MKKANSMPSSKFYKLQAAAAAAAIDIAPPGVSSRISSSSTANFLAHTNPWASAFTAANIASASLGLKRSSDALYHPTILSTIGQNEAWYTTNSLAKRPRYEAGSTLSIYPHRPGKKESFSRWKNKVKCWWVLLRFLHCVQGLNGSSWLMLHLKFTWIFRGISF